MKSDSKFFKRKKFLPADLFFKNVLYDKKLGYYNSKLPLGAKGDFLTSPNISNLFSEMIAIWIISTWENYGRPEKINIVELGPGDGSLVKILLNVFKRFPEFDSAKKIYLFEKSNFLKNLQKKSINNNEVKWINNFKNIKGGPVIFFGNEFLDAIPIKQFKKNKNSLLEKYFVFQNNRKIKEVFKKASKQDLKTINSYKILKRLKFIEFPKEGLKELKKIIKKITSLYGCLLLIDYGYLKPNNQNTLQSVYKHKKNEILKNLGRADITTHVNFSLINEFFLKNKLKVKQVISQKEFLENMGIKERAEILSKNFRFTSKIDLYSRLKRLLSPNSMGHLFKVALTYSSKTSNYAGFK